MPGPTCRAPVEIGYAAVQAWRSEDPVGLAARLADAGATVSQAEVGPGDDLAPLARWVTAMRTRGIVAWVVAANWNDPAWHGIDRDGWRRHVQAVLATGPDWLEPISEGDARAIPLLDIAAEEAARHPVRWVRPFGFAEPSSAPPPFALRDIHYCSLDALREALATARPDVVHTTDCSPLLASRLSAETIQSLVRQARVRRARLLLYDTFGVGTSPAVLASLRAGLCGP